MSTSEVRQVSYADFIGVLSNGIRNLHDAHELVDSIVKSMMAFHQESILVDMRGAQIAPLPENVMQATMEYMKKAGIGVYNKVAMVTDPDDELRIERGKKAESIAVLMEMHVRVFQCYSTALEWLNEPI